MRSWWKKRQERSQEKNKIKRAHKWARQVEIQEEKEKKARFARLQLLLESDPKLAAAYAKSWNKKPLPYRGKGGDKRTKRRRRLSSKKRKYTKKHKKTRRRRR